MFSQRLRADWARSGRALCPAAGRRVVGTAADV